MSTNYEIRVKGNLDSSWSEWLEGMKINPLENGDTILSGPLTDQAALFGLLNRLRDMNVGLVLVEKKEDGRT